MENFFEYEMLAAMPTLCYWKNTQGRYLGCTNLLKEKLGLPFDEVIKGKTDLDLIWRSQSEFFINAEKKSLELNKTKEFLCKLNFLNQFDVFCKVVVKPFYAQNLNEKIILGSIEILSETKKSVFSNEFTLQEIFDQIPCNVYWKDLNGVYIGANKSVLKMINFKSSREIAGKTDEDLLLAGGKNHKVFLEKILKVDREIIKTGISKLNIEELPFEKFGGDLTYLLTNKSPLIDNFGKIIGIIGISVDISSLRKKRDILVEEKERAQKSEKSTLKNLERVISFMPGNVYWKDTEGIYRGCNDAVAEMFGLLKSEIIGKNDTFLLKNVGMPQKIIDGTIKLDQEIIKTGLPRLNIEEPPFRAADKKWVYQLTNKVPIKDENDNVVGIVGISLDLSEKKQLEEYLREALVREEQLKVLSSMGGMIAHELRTPLSAMALSVRSIRNYFSTLIEVYKQWSQEKKERPISAIHLKGLSEACNNLAHSLEQADETVNMILNGFRPKEFAKANLKQVAVNDLFKALLTEYPLSEAQLALVQVEENSQANVLCDKRTVVYVLTNLLKNALYYVGEAGKGVITLWAEAQHEKTFLYVRDTGSGIPADRLDKIFEPFYTSKYVGTSIGMGLYFCKMALESMGAEIFCRSEFGEFTEFKLVFPSKVRNA